MTNLSHSSYLHSFIHFSSVINVYIYACTCTTGIYMYVYYMFYMCLHVSTWIYWYLNITWFLGWRSKLLPVRHHKTRLFAVYARSEISANVEDHAVSPIIESTLKRWAGLVIKILVIVCMLGLSYLRLVWFDWGNELQFWILHWQCVRNKMSKINK